MGYPGFYCSDWLDHIVTARDVFHSHLLVAPNGGALRSFTVVGIPKRIRLWRHFLCQRAD